MENSLSFVEWRDDALFTPGPLTTSRSVKQAMLRDLGSRDENFLAIVADIRRRLVALAGVKEPDYTCVLMQGSGTFAIEATIGSVLPPDGRLLILANGAYGERMARIATQLRIDTVWQVYPEDHVIRPDEVESLLAADPTISHVAIVHCETTTGLINPVAEIGPVVRRHGRTFIVDAMSSFAAYPIPMDGWGVDFLVSSANKCIEGVPGFAFVLARTASLQATAGFARSVSLGLLEQWQGLESNGQFRFTPPVQALLAFHQALLELDAEGGIATRAGRYQDNHQETLVGLRALGFREYLKPEDMGYIITSFHYPKHANFVFDEFYNRLKRRGFVIYPGKLSRVDCFRIGHIGRITPADVAGLLLAIRETLIEMDIDAI